MKIVIEKDKETGMASLLCGEYEEFSDSTYEEFELWSVHNIEKLVEWAIRRSYASGLHDGRKE